MPTRRLATAACASLAAALAVASACGGSRTGTAGAALDAGGSATEQPDASGPAAAGGEPVADGGAVAGGPAAGGGAPIGTPSAAGEGAAGSLDGGAVTAGGPATDAGSAGAGCPALPAPGSPVEVALDVSDVPFCQFGASDGEGQAVALGLGLHHMSFSVYPMSGGAPTGAIEADHQDTGPFYTALVGSHVGFQALRNTGVESVADRGSFAAHDQRGAVVASGAELTGMPRLIKSDPTAGSVLLTVSGTYPGPETHHLEYMAADGRRRALVTLDRQARDIAVATNGKVLVLSNDSTARWFDREGGASTDWFPVAVPAPPAGGRIVLEALSGGAIALRAGDEWSLVFRGGVAAAEPAPAWLQDRRGKDVFPVLGALLDAFVRRVGSAYDPGCDRPRELELELLTPSGTRCATVVLPAAPPDATPWCSEVAIGRDGTPLTLSAGPSATVGHQRCTWRWWPGLLR